MHDQNVQSEKRTRVDVFVDLLELTKSIRYDSFECKPGRRNGEPTNQYTFELKCGEETVIVQFNIAFVLTMDDMDYIEFKNSTRTNLRAQIA